MSMGVRNVRSFLRHQSPQRPPLEFSFEPKVLPSSVNYIIRKKRLDWYLFIALILGRDCMYEIKIISAWNKILPAWNKLAFINACLHVTTSEIKVSISGWSATFDMTHSSANQRLTLWMHNDNGRISRRFVFISSQLKCPRQTCRIHGCWDA